MGDENFGQNPFFVSKKFSEFFFARRDQRVKWKKRPRFFFAEKRVERKKNSSLGYWLEGGRNFFRRKMRENAKITFLHPKNQKKMIFREIFGTWFHDQNAKFWWSALFGEPLCQQINVLISMKIYFRINF